MLQRVRDWGHGGDGTGTVIRRTPDHLGTGRITGSDRASGVFHPNGAVPGVDVDGCGAAVVGAGPRPVEVQTSPADMPAEKRGSTRVGRVPYREAVSSHHEAEVYLQALNSSVRQLAAASHQRFVVEGCSSYVKTTYIGYDFGGDMVAALYGHADHVEIRLPV